MKTNPDSGRPAPTVSVIVPVFNDAAGVDKLLHSLSDQTHFDFELIVVDNGSMPPLKLPTHHQLDAKLVYCPTPGSYVARNTGVLAATGSYLVFTDADCEPAPDWLSCAVGLMENKGADVFFGGEVRFRQPSVRSGTALYQYLTGFQQEENIRNKRFSATANLFCHRTAFDRVGNFDERLLSGGDREWCWRAQKKGMTLQFAPEVVVWTHVRHRLGAAMRQARRVAGGRRALEQLELTWSEVNGALQPIGSRGANLVKLLRTVEISYLEKLRVLTAAVVLRCAALVESLRLGLNTQPERR